MKFFLAGVIAILFLTAEARDEIGFSAALGLRSNEAETDVGSATVTSQVGLQAGILAYLPVSSWVLRTGALYTQRSINLGPVQEGDVEVRYSYFDIPLTPVIRLSDYAGFFGGPLIAFNQSRDVSCSKVSNCSAFDVRSIIVPLQLGFQFRFLDQVGAEIFYEYVPGELSTNVSNMRTFGGNLTFYFE